MSKKITITEKKARTFNNMLRSLRLIAKEYQTPDQLRKESKNDWGLGYEEALEMSYENIQNEAKQSSAGVKFIPIEKD